MKITQDNPRDISVFVLGIAPQEGQNKLTSPMLTEVVAWVMVQ